MLIEIRALSSIMRSTMSLTVIFNNLNTMKRLKNILSKIAFTLFFTISVSSISCDTNSSTNNTPSMNKKRVRNSKKGKKNISNSKKNEGREFISLFLKFRNSVLKKNLPKFKGCLSENLFYKIKECCGIHFFFDMFFELNALRDTIYRKIKIEIIKIERKNKNARVTFLKDRKNKFSFSFVREEGGWKVSKNNFKEYFEFKILGGRIYFKGYEFSIRLPDASKLENKVEEKDSLECVFSSKKMGYIIFLDLYWNKKLLEAKLKDYVREFKNVYIGKEDVINYSKLKKIGGYDVYFISTSPRTYSPKIYFDYYIFRKDKKIFTISYKTSSKYYKYYKRIGFIKAVVYSIIFEKD